MSAIHSSYLKLIEPCESEQLVSDVRELSPLVTSPQKPIEAEKIYPQNNQTNRANSLVFVICTLVIAMFGSDFISKASDYFSRLHIVISPQVERASNPQPIADHDIEIMKKILTGLVPAVEQIKDELDSQKLKAQQTVLDLDAPFTYNKSVRVRSDKAYVREKPNKEAKSLMTIAKDTVLFADSIIGDWLEVNLPIGGKGYIHQSIVQDEERKDAAIKPEEESSVEKPKVST